jgi:hypothetical protein
MDFNRYIPLAFTNNLRLSASKLKLETIREKKSIFNASYLAFHSRVNGRKMYGKRFQPMFKKGNPPVYIHFRGKYFSCNNEENLFVYRG